MHGIRFVAAGIVLGVGAAFFTARLLTTSLCGVSATDAKTMTAVPPALLAMAVAGCLGPGRRAARLDPAEILREN